LQEETRSTYADVLRALARDETASDRFHLRLLALDPADEEVHLGLIRMLADAGRHGEARRAHRRYVQQMRELGLEPVALDAAING
ncbi:MAG: BTAD domain-containing putative transcriptional regulator, partial [Gaiella sp.]